MALSFNPAMPLLFLPSYKLIQYLLFSLLGAYTTFRTHENASYVMFWERHLRRLVQSVEILGEKRPDLYPLKCRFESSWDIFIRPLVDSSLKNGLALALKKRKHGEELAITSLVHGTTDQPDDDSVVRPCDVYVHIGGYLPMKFGLSDSAACLALVGQSREIAMSKFSEWARTRKYLEKLRAPLVTELLLSNDGDHILEGTVTNFFVVCRREMNQMSDEGPTNPNDMHPYMVQTAPLNDGVLPGSKSWEEVSWEMKDFRVG
ncbi:hypothetical protein EJ110_NYTH09186 [Nymphaea thermarum]|nr:hypothetical protein EJ110_NYTH09186 [Nymphaea thermarum]